MKELYDGLCIYFDKPTDVSYLAHQGAMMFNEALTTGMNKAGSHLELWEPFVKCLFEQVLAYSGIPLILLGKEAYKTRNYLTGFDWFFQRVIQHQLLTRIQNVIQKGCSHRLIQLSN